MFKWADNTTLEPGGIMLAILLTKICSVNCTDHSIQTTYNMACWGRSDHRLEDLLGLEFFKVEIRNGNAAHRKSHPRVGTGTRD